MNTNALWIWIMHFKIITCTKESLKTLVWYIMIIGWNWKTCEFWFTCNWFNGNIKSLRNVELKPKARLWTCFNYIIKKIKIIVINLHGFQIFFNNFNLHPTFTSIGVLTTNCITSFSSSFVLSPSLFWFFLFVKHLWQQIIHPLVHWIWVRTHIEKTWQPLQHIHRVLKKCMI